MNKYIIFTVCALFIGLTMILSNVQISESVLSSKMLISVKAEKDPITEGGFPTIIGTVKDQAYKPISNANVLIRFGTIIVTTTTDDKGDFRYQSATPSTHGIYEIDVTATKDGYAKSDTSSTFTVSPRQVISTVTKTITGLPIQT